MAEVELKFVDENAEGLDPALRAFGQGADRVSSVKDFVEQVLGKLGPNDCIKKLELIGHGSPGNIGVGSGKIVARTGTNSLDLNNVAQWEPQIRRLRCKFCKPGGEFNLIGCNTGADLAGARLLRLIVNFIRCCKAKAPVEIVVPLTKSEVDQIVEAIGEDEDEHAKLPTPIEPKKLKTVSMQLQFGTYSLMGGAKLSSLKLYDPATIVGARVLKSSSRGLSAEALDVDSEAVSSIRKSLNTADVALAPVGLFGIESYLQFRVKPLGGRAVWLSPGALVGGCRYYSPFGNDTSFLYALALGAREELMVRSNPENAKQSLADT